MNIEQMLSILDADIVARLKTAVEIGKWPNGVVLTTEQRQISMQAGNHLQLTICFIESFGFLWRFHRGPWYCRYPLLLHRNISSICFQTQ